MDARPLLTVLLTSVLTLPACKTREAAAAAPDSTAPEPGAAAPSEPGAPEIAWADKSRQQRMEYMGIHVFPKMKAVFGKDDFKCQTCHGDDMEEIEHRMPNDLYPLPAEGFYEAAVEYDEEVAKFMATEVVPAMSEVLGQDVNCLSCHPTE